MITLELLLVIVLVVIPLLIGMVLLGRKAYTLYLNQRDFTEQPYSRGVIWDSSQTPKVIGPVIGYNSIDAPLVIFRDAASKAGVPLGVRVDRFTSSGRVYYDDAGCTVNPKIRAYDATVQNNSASPPPGIGHQMQGRSYAMGKGNVLYASSQPKANGVSIAATSLWAWNSQDQSVTGPCVQPGTGTITDLVTGEVVIDFDGPGNYVAPFRLTFPTPGTLPALTSTGG